MGIQQGYDLIKAVFLDTVILDISWAISLIFTLLTLLLITKEVDKWKSLAFPVMVLIHIAGIPPFILIYLGSAIIFAIESLSLQTIGSLLSIIKLPKKEEGFTEKEKRMYQQENLRAKRKEVKALFKKTGSMPELNIDEIIKRK